MKREMRRFRQALSIEESKEILRKGIVAVLAVDGDDDFSLRLTIKLSLSRRLRVLPFCSRWS